MKPPKKRKQKTIPRETLVERFEEIKLLRKRIDDLERRERSLTVEIERLFQAKGSKAMTGVRFGLGQFDADRPAQQRSTNPLEKELYSRRAAVLGRSAWRAWLCIVDISSAGMKLRSHCLTLLPLAFDFTFDNFTTVQRCRLIWRRGDLLGALFDNNLSTQQSQ